MNGVNGKKERDAEKGRNAAKIRRKMKKKDLALTD